MTVADQTFRSFITTPVGRMVETELISLRKRVSIPDGLDVSWEGDHNHHITLRFLGDVTRELGEAVMLGAVADGEPDRLRLRLAEFGAFPDWEHPTILYVKVGGDIDRLAAIQARIDGLAQAAGVPPVDFPFNPHITVGRVRNATPEQGEALKGRMADVGVASLAWRVCAIQLCRSERRRGVLGGWQVRYPVMKNISIIRDM